MKTKKKSLAFFLSLLTCFSIIVLPTSAIQPRWTNTNRISSGPYPTEDYYFVDVYGIQGTTKIEINATLKEKNIFGIYVEKDTASGTYYGMTGRLDKTYDMNPNKDYKVTATIYVTANGYRETIEI